MPATLHYIGRDQAAQALVPAGAGQSEKGLMWHPLIYVGQWEHPAFGAFEITLDDLFAMASAFQGGVPTSLGVPIDEWNDHSISKDGAFGWLKALEVRDDALWAGYTLTPLGKAKVETEELPFLSAHFFVRGTADNLYKSESYIQSVALTSRPFFWEQPQLPVEQIAASAYVRKDDDNDGGDAKMGAEARK
ncbi:MAG: phage protease, partial [Candidatus Thermoplasmatota archaeon]|nr:phage protease [Candidatus Thermoplasmatota archaeon]